MGLAMEGAAGVRHCAWATEGAKDGARPCGRYGRSGRKHGVSGRFRPWNELLVARADLGGDRNRGAALRPWICTYIIAATNSSSRVPAMFDRMHSLRELIYRSLR
uniref:Uncharacterized protein n=1 Tax=Arundo donax TaxID=35708 RepID=A0A0A9BUQ4_ARUDO